ncbi:MAG TPA: molybdopterin cofactor-binding domain-containing protein [Caldimonas sp.]|jgi:isoquinoline 1-oxidoreductase beta subunit|nr:molybdopterin cofactor-binding domain-containing protein [Caldimonas sp.]HEV7575464.1 molybdopterin cofactor-binding domain-containing protein [Caldimonas sp.]
MKRRALLVSGVGAAGALVVGWGLLPPRDRLGAVDALAVDEGEVSLNGWIKIGADGAVMLAMNRSEMGQGTHTALAMLVADELDVPLARVRIVQAGPDRLYGNVATMVASVPYFHPRETEPGNESTPAKAGQWVVAKVARELGINLTGGSSSVVDAWDVLRVAAATARARLVGAASIAWKQPAGEIVVRDGVVSHPAGSSAHYGELARMAAATPTGAVRLKRREEWRLIGTAAPRIDAAAKSDGSARFGIDVRPSGLVFAAIRHCPMLGGSPGAVDVAPALALAGVERVVRLGPYAGSTAALAVVGRTWWHAQRGAAALKVEWQQRPAGALDSAVVMAQLEASARAAASGEGGFAFHGRGDIAGAEARAARQVEQTYRAPYLAHAAMEPINCTARVAAGQVEVWAPTQVPGLARAIAASVAGVDEDAVIVHVTYLGGGFGRRLDVDFVGQAVRIALETGGRPVQLIWSREEDLMHDFYRPAAVAILRAGLGADGMPQTLRVTSAGDAITPRWMERGIPHLAGPVDTPDKTTSEGLFDQLYAIPNQRIAHVATLSGVPIGYWRSVGHSHNAFFIESFIDELAHAAGRDPVDYRLALLRESPRHAAVLRLAAERAGWPGQGRSRPLEAGRARGVAVHESFGSIVAEVVEASIENGRPRVHRVVCAADIGTVVNPGIVAQQMEGAVIFALSAALDGRIDIVGGVVQQTNFPSYPVLRLGEAPRVETHLVDSTRSPGGVGEIATPPLAPALANALFALTGKRLRELPLRL